MDFTATTLGIATVALFARAWIEIINSGPLLYWMQVALFARAWIEIKHYDSPKGRRKKSPSLRGRGLKFFTYYVHDNGNKSPSLRGRGLKLPNIVCLFMITRSPSLRGRGLK